MHAETGVVITFFISLGFALGFVTGKLVDFFHA